MNNLDRTENKLFLAFHSDEKKSATKVWMQIQSYHEILKEALQIVYDENNIAHFRGPIICDFIINNKDKNYYAQLVNQIFSHTQLARCKDGTTGSNDVSYLLKILNDFHLMLTDEQKHFAEKEAEEEYLNKTKYHNQSLFDLRLLILENPNWSENEKRVLVSTLFTADEYQKLIDDVKQFTLDMITGRTTNEFEQNNFFETITERDLYPIMNYYVHDTHLIWKRVQLVRMLETLKNPTISLQRIKSENK